MRRLLAAALGAARRPQHAHRPPERSGELGTDLGPIGAWWGSRVAESWERAVAESLRSVAAFV